ncbi:alpha-crystallin A chain-like [Euwallacea fornicatus]|uniref:alpha-crystallin A chain-like n=1 Tax=Euwallacea fornicatus TaxID=995702 RepID=UPI00338F740A
MDQVIFHPDHFEILIDLRGFRPEEIKCILTANTVEVIAQNAQQMENAQKILYLVRQYLLPKNASSEQGYCCLVGEGMLFITAPWIM